MKEANGLTDITIGEMIELAKILKMPYSKAQPIHKAFVEKHNLTDEQGRNALNISKRIVKY